jgi:ABC-2 type transport system permease protein
MWSIAKRELRLYFCQLTGYLVVVGYLIITSLTLWFFNSPFNLLNRELGDFNPFFKLSPILFLFLITALSMRTFSEEFAQGTFELLLTKPLHPYQIFGGKILGVLLILSIAMFPTLLHAFTLDGLLQEDTKLDWGVLGCSYLALFLLALFFIVTSMCASLIFQSQVASFLLGVVACFIHLYSWSFIADFAPTVQGYKWINSLGASVHYDTLSRGIIALEDLFYFFGMVLTFFLTGVELIQKKKRK